LAIEWMVVVNRSCSFALRATASQLSSSASIVVAVALLSLRVLARLAVVAIGLVVRLVSVVSFGLVVAVAGVVAIVLCLTLLAEWTLVLCIGLVRAGEGVVVRNIGTGLVVQLIDCLRSDEAVGVEANDREGDGAVAWYR
jgi:hypothetical protein